MAARRTPKKPTPKKRGKPGKPRAVIDFDELYRLMGIQCTAEECAAFLGVGRTTLYNHIKQDLGTTFEELFKQHSKAGWVSLRRKQMQVALNGDKAMLIWLGKQYLGQSDKRELNNRVSLEDVRDKAAQLGAIVQEHVKDPEVLEKIKEAWSATLADG